jgi:hypothetical protein
MPCDARRCRRRAAKVPGQRVEAQVERQRHRDDEADQHHQTRPGGAIITVGEVGNEKGERVGEGAPGEEILEIDRSERGVDRVEHENVGRGDDHDHGGNGRDEASEHILHLYGSR